MGQARFLVFSSPLYEGLARTIIEAFAKGTPVLASNLGSTGTIVEHGRTGLHVEPGNPDDLAAKVAWAWTHPVEMTAMGQAARREFEAKYAAERNYALLMEIYQRAMGQPIDRPVLTKT
jgi:glycosyltransferase involved in cell wall biosynthesis